MISSISVSIAPKLEILEKTIFNSHNLWILCWASPKPVSCNYEVRNLSEVVLLA